MAETDIRFITAEGLYGQFQDIEYEKALFDELNQTVERHGANAIAKDHPELIELCALGARLTCLLNDFAVPPSNRALIRAHNPKINLRSRADRFGLGVGLTVMSAPWVSDLGESSDMSKDRADLLLNDIKLLNRIEQLIPAAIISALSLGASKALKAYKSPVADRLNSFNDAIAQGAVFKASSPTERFGRQDLFVIFWQMQGHDQDGGYLNADGYVVDDLASARFFSSPKAAADFAGKNASHYSGPPRWAVARFNAAPIELMRPDGAPIPDLPLFSGVVAQAQALALEKETAPKPAKAKHRGL